MKNAVFFTICLSCIFGLLYAYAVNSSRYRVVVIYCDDRDNDTIVYRSLTPPSSSSIDNYKNAVPEFGGKINVCDIKTISYAE